MNQNNELQSQPYLTLNQASNYLGLSRSTLYSYTHKKVIPFYKIRRKLLFKVEELNNFIENHRVKTQSEIETEASTRVMTQN